MCSNYLSIFFLLLVSPSFAAQSAKAQPIGMGGVEQAASSISNVGVQLHPDFPETGGFTVQLQVSSEQATTPENFLEQFQQSIDYVDCAINQPTPLCCLCEETGVVKGSAGGALDVAIDIDSSGSNVAQPGVDIPSDPDNLRLVAAQQVVDALLTGSNHVAAFNFGTLYCTNDCPNNDLGNFYKGLKKLGSETYRFSDGYVDVAQKEVIKSNLSKASWSKNNGTPLYNSLGHIMDDMSIAIQRNSVKVIVVFSDGEPSDSGESDVCEQAQEMGVKIISIGYGPASIKNENKNTAAVEVLQNLATCSGGSFLSIEDIGEIAAKAKSVGESLTQGHVDLLCNLSDPTQMMTTATMVEGTATLHSKNSLSTQTVSFNFIPSMAPVPATMPGQLPTMGAECPQPKKNIPPLVEDEPLPEVPVPVLPVEPPPVEDTGEGAEPECQEGSPDFPACLVILAENPAECQAQGGTWVVPEGIVIPAHIYAEMQRLGHGVMTLPDGTVVKFSPYPGGATSYKVIGQCLRRGTATVEQGDGSGPNCSLSSNSKGNPAHSLFLIFVTVFLLVLRGFGIHRFDDRF